MRKHIRIRKKNKPITVNIRRLRPSKTVPATDRLVGRGSLYGPHIDGALDASDKREDRQKRGQTQYFEATTTDDQTNFYLTEKETIAAIQAYSMDKEFRPKVREHQRSMKQVGNDGKLVTVDFLNQFDDYDNTTINEYAKLLVEFEGWEYYPKGMDLRKLRIKQRYS